MPLENPVKGDWSEQVLSDIREINLQLSIQEIKQLSRESFRGKVKKAIETAAFKWLIAEKGKLSKVKNLSYGCLKMQNYLVGSELKTREKKFLFLLRTRMLDVKTNFRNHHSDLSCPLCGLWEDDQKHNLECSVLLKNIPDVATEKPNYDDIFADDVLKQMKILRIFMKLWKTKKN